MRDWIKHNWLAVVVLVAILGSFWVSHTETQNANRASIARAVDTCNRGNPSRAYLQVRAVEFPKSIVTGHSYTTEIAPDVYAILDCDATVANKGVPVPLSPGAEVQYLAWFKERYIPTVKDGEIVGKVPFSTYYAR